MKKVNILFGLLWLVIIKSGAQNISAANDFATRYTINPAERTGDSLIKINIIGAYIEAGGNNAGIKLSDYKHLGIQFARNNILGTKDGSSGWSKVGVNGPSLFIPLGKKNQVSVAFNSRVLANYWNVDGRLVGEVNETNRAAQQYPYFINQDSRMIFNVASWSEIALGYNRVIWQNGADEVSLGGSFKLLNGAAHSSIDVLLNGGTVDISPSYITSATGTFSTITSGELFNNFSVGNLFKGKLTPAVDLGIIYKNKTVKAGLSVSNIGSLKFKADSAYSKNYNITIEGGKRLYFNQQFSNVTFNHISEELDANPTMFSRTAINRGVYKIGLPTTLNLFADYTFNSVFGARADMILGLTEKENVGELSAPFMVSLVPRFEKKKLGIYLPLRVQQFSGFSAGATIRYGGFYLGSSSILSGSVAKSKQIDFFAGWGININETKKNKIVKSDYKKPIDILQNTEVSKLLQSYASVSTIYTSNKTVPFWLRSNRGGAIPLKGFSLSTMAGIAKKYDDNRKYKLLDWGAGLELMGNLGSNVEGRIIEAYAKARVGFFEIKAGRSKDRMGFVDSSLSSGAFSMSGNALGIPKIEISIPEFIDVPYTNGWLGVKGNIAHGWMGDYTIRPSNEFNYLVETSYALLHQKSFYLRIGKKSNKVRAYGGFNHQAQWGNERAIFGSGYELNDFQSFKYVFLGNEYGNNLVPTSKIGNQLGSLDQGLEVESKNLLLTGYHQFFYDIGGLYHLSNVEDGLWGVSLKNKKSRFGSKKIYFKKGLIEFYYSKGQGGKPGSKPTPSGAENYYNNFLYFEGWSYKGEVLGNPLVTSKQYIRKDLPQRDNEYFNNNRILAFHLGAEMEYGKCAARVLLTYSQNFGNWSTAPAMRSRNATIVYNPGPHFQKVNQLSGYLQAQRPIGKKISINAELAVDAGKLLYNSVGGSLGLRYNLLSLK